MLTALVVVLQTAATFIRFGSFPITLTLIPIVVAGALYGVASGALIGTVFGLVVLVLFFDTSWAAVLSAFMSVNFLLELAVNIVLAPAVLRIVTMRRRTA